MNRLPFAICIVSFVAAFLLSGHAQSPTPAAPPPSPQEHNAMLPMAHVEAGSRTFSTYCAGCHGSDARGGERAPDIATARNLIAISDDDLESIVKRGVPGSGMPSFAYLGDQGVKDVVAHLRTLQGKGSAVKITGDPQTGRTLFFGRGGCSECHMVKGEGGYIASDLTGYASGTAPEAIYLAITKPDVVLAPTSSVVDLLLPNGERVTGMARAEDNFNITVQTIDGRWRTFDKAHLASVKHTDHSIHPRNYDTRLSAKELEDLVSYLMVSAANAPPKPARRRNQ